MSGSSSEDECEEVDPSDPPVPKWPLPPACSYDTEVYAFWDLLNRPHGCSVRKLEVLFRAKHGAPMEGWLAWLERSPYFVFYQSRVGAQEPPRDRTLLGLLNASRVSSLRVRRLWPEAFCAGAGVPSARLRGALDSFVQWSVERAADREAADLRFAGAASVPRQQWAAPLAPFSHRLMDRRSDAEALYTPFPVCNVPPTTVDDVIPPPDLPDVQASDVSEVLTHNAVAAVASFYRRYRRVARLKRAGDMRAAAKAKPQRPLQLNWRSNTKAPFKGIPMDLCSWPFKPLQPSRWPDRPPSTTLHIRALRKEFRDHPDIPHQRLKSLISHGNPRGGACEKVTFLDGPHGSSWRHFELWCEQSNREIDRGWSRVGHPDALGLTSWPSRCQPTSMVERNGAWRLCHDMSWPLAGAVEGVTSPNGAECDIRRAKFAVFNDLANAASIMAVAGAPLALFKIDLPKAYKQNGQQRSTLWARSCLGPSGRSQTLDRVCFGQSDGPELFSGQTDVHCFLLKREFQYAEACYPSRCAEVLAWQEARREAARALGGDELEFALLAFIIAMIDDFGAVAFDDLLFRIDGSAVRLPCGQQRTRAHLIFSIVKSFVKRMGYEPLDLEKLLGPCRSMLFLGAILDLDTETKRLDPDKRERYLQRLQTLIAGGSMTVAASLRMAFRLMVVCQMKPAARQWLHSWFRAARGKSRSLRLQWERHPDMAGDANRFVALLSSADPIAAPLAFRVLLAPAGAHAAVKYEDASGLPQPHEASDHEAGFGSWSVRDGCLFYIAGLWSAEESQLLHITILEACITFFSTPTYLECSAFSGVQYVLEYSDNTGAEWMARKETPHAHLLQLVAAKRAEMLQQLGLFVTTARVSSEENSWADDLSRQRVMKVEHEARLLGLQPVRLEVPVQWRDLAWLLDAARP